MQTLGSHSTRMVLQREDAMESAVTCFVKVMANQRMAADLPVLSMGLEEAEQRHLNAWPSDML